VNDYRFTLADLIPLGLHSRSVFDLRQHGLMAQRRGRRFHYTARQVAALRGLAQMGVIGGGRCEHTPWPLVEAVLGVAVQSDRRWAVLVGGLLDRVTDEPDEIVAVVQGSAAVVTVIDLELGSDPATIVE
jgi:hypothetical protein